MSGISPIRATSVIQIVESYGGDERDVDKVLRIEQRLYPAIYESSEGGENARN